MIDWSTAGRPMPGEVVSGDLHLVKFLDHGALVAVLDGVGHGQEARAVAQTAAEILETFDRESVIALTRRCHEALARTRGVVMTLAWVDGSDDTVTWLGVGNVEGRLLRSASNDGQTSESLLLRNGLVGLQLPALQASLMPLAPGDLLVFVTDGIRADFEANINLTETPRQIADRILSQSSKNTDDALVLVARYTGKTP